MLEKRMGQILAVMLAWGCNGAGGGGEAPGSGSVTGRFAGQDFDFVPSQVEATFEGVGGGSGVLRVLLCEATCGGDLDGGPTRSVSLAVQAPTADLRVGASFLIGREASAHVIGLQGGEPVVLEAVAGEVVIESSDLREGGRAVGTFQLELGAGSIVGGFFEAPLTRVSGEVVVL